MTKRLISVGDILPRLSLAGPAGIRHAVGPGATAPLLLFVHPAPCPACDDYLAGVAVVVDDLASWATRVVAVAPGAGVEEAGPFPVLGDQDGAARRRLGIGDDEAAVLLADRWGEVFEVAAFGPDHGFPLPRQLVESAKIVDLSCGECNVPSPEWRATR